MRTTTINQYKPCIDPAPTIDEDVSADETHFGDPPTSGGCVEEQKEGRAGGKRHHHLIAIYGFVTISGFLLGYDLCVISSALSYIADDFGLPEQGHSLWSTRSLIVSTVSLGALLGSLVGGIVCDCFGRRRGLALSAALFTAGGLSIALAPAITVVIAGRVVVGCALGVGGVAAPIYITEMSDPAVRGRLVTLNEIMTCMGCLTASSVNALLANVPLGAWAGQNGWRLMMGLCCVPACVQLIGIVAHVPISHERTNKSEPHDSFAGRSLLKQGAAQWMPLVPETPTFLASFLRKSSNVPVEGRDAIISQIQHVLLLTQPSRAGAHAELQRLVGDLTDTGDVQQNSTAPVAATSIIPPLPVLKANLWPLMLAIGMAVGQNLTAANSVLYFGTDILSLAGVKSSEIATIALGFAKLFGVCACLCLVDHPQWGRRKLLLYGTAGQIVCFLLLAVGLLPTSSPLEAGEMSTPIAAIALIGFIFFWDISWAGLMFLVIPEVLTDEVRAFGTSAAITVFWILSFVVGQVLESMFSAFPPNQAHEDPQKHPAGTFLFFAATSCVSLAFVKFCLPETGMRRLQAEMCDGDHTSAVI